VKGVFARPYSGSDFRLLLLSYQLLEYGLDDRSQWAGDKLGYDGCFSHNPLSGAPAAGLIASMDLSEYHPSTPAASGFHCGSF
jgi:hypothetical protein